MFQDATGLSQLPLHLIVDKECQEWIRGCWLCEHASARSAQWATL